MILLVDNYDSFAYNLYQMIGSFDPDVLVVRNDDLTINEIRGEAPQRIIISPGPGRPENAGNIIEVIQEFGGKVPILGVCLGHQAVCSAYGGNIVYAKELMHGKQSVAHLDPASPLFAGLPESIEVARYHSLTADAKTLPDCLKVIARTDDGEIMGVAHKEHQVYGLQFHPESILTPRGQEIIGNFVALKPTSEEAAV
ncbi:MAG: aminodeoxychorismate/anthranilate synthase component II [Clostridia bacterium]|nr:aminodeoxychorismate/anthranilate synthase component II [Clostridia bacterium]